MKTLTAFFTFLGAALLVAGNITFTNSEGTPVTYVASYLHSFTGPQTYKDTDSGIIFYVEGDGRHVAAIGSDGKILWYRDPFADAHIKPYRTATPRIIFIGNAGARHEAFWASNGIPHVIGITYDSSQFGFINAKTGDLKIGGQD